MMLKFAETIHSMFRASSALEYDGNYEVKEGNRTLN